MSNIKLSSQDYNAIALIISGKSSSDSNVKKLASDLEKGNKGLNSFGADKADAIADYLSARKHNLGKPVELWKNDGEVSKDDLKIDKKLRKEIDTNKDNKISTKEFAEAIRNEKVIIGKERVPDTIFKSDAEKSAAEKYLDRFSGNAFDPVRSTEDKFLNLKPINMQALNGNFSSLPQKDVGDVNLDDLVGVKNNDEFLQAVKNSLAKTSEVKALYGANPTQAQLDAYLKENFDAILQQIGDDFPYDGLVSMTGDSNTMTTLDNGYGVCTDIHAVVTSLRRAAGQEAYLVQTTGSDAAHVFTVFKEDGKWNIQNYGIIIQTDATTIAELYDQVMPEQRKIKLYDIDSDGNVKQLSTDHYTALGLAERRFKAESGIGSFNPWTTEEGMNISNNDISIFKNGFFVGVNPSNNTVGTAYYKKTQEGDTRKIIGGAIEGQYHTNPNGYEAKHLDAKFEIEKKYDNAEKQTFGRSHLSVFAGTEMNTSPVYWGNISDGSTPVAGADDPAIRFGAQYSRNDSKLYGDGTVKFELGHQTRVGGTITFSATEPLTPDYVGRIYSDAVGESKLVTGAFIQPNKDLTVRAGLATGVDLAKIDGYKDISEQVKNITESDAYLDISYAKGPVAVKAMGYIPLQTVNSSFGAQYKVGAGIAYVPTKEIAFGATYIHEKIGKDNIDYLRVGAEITPRENISIGAAISSPVFGDNAKDIRGEGYVKIRF